MKKFQCLALLALFSGLSAHAQVADSEPSQFFKCIDAGRSYPEKFQTRVSKDNTGIYFYDQNDNVYFVPFHKELGTAKGPDPYVYDPEESPTGLNSTLFNRQFKVPTSSSTYYLGAAEDGWEVNFRVKTTQDKGTNYIPIKDTKQYHSHGDIWGDNSREVLEQEAADRMKSIKKSCNSATQDHCLESLKACSGLNGKFQDLKTLYSDNEKAIKAIPAPTTGSDGKGQAGPVSASQPE